MRKSWLVAILLGVLWASAALGGRGGQQAPAQPAPPSGTGFIAGRVVEVPSGRPVSEATVILSVRGVTMPAVGAGRGAPLSYRVTADVQGRFFFARLPKGSFTLTVQHDEYGPAPIPGHTRIELEDGERIVDAVLRLSRFASISGTVRDSNGDPVVGMFVRAFRRGMSNGRPVYLPVFGLSAQSMSVTTNGKTDDRGAYRLSPLPAGEYLVCACVRDPVPFDDTLLRTIGSQPAQLLAVGVRALAGGAETVALDGTMKTLAPTLYPGAATIDRAEMVKVAPGEDREGVDVRMPLVRAARISGRVVGASGPVQASSIRLSALGSARDDLFSFPPMLVQPDGRFDFANVPPGQYRISVDHREPSTPSGSALAGAPSGEALRFLGGSAAFPVAARGRGAAVDYVTLWAEAEIVVGDRDISDLVLTLDRGTRVSGRLVFEGPPSPEAPPRQAVLALVDADGRRQLETQRAGDTFTMFTPPGRYALQVVAQLTAHRIKSVVVGGLDVTDMPFDVGARGVAGVVVTLTDEPPAALTVGVAAIGTERIPEGMVAVFPVDRKYWDSPVTAAQRFQFATLTPKRTATVQGLPAGEYFAAFDPEFEWSMWPSRPQLEKLAGRATRVTLADRDSKAIEVRR